MWSSSGPRARRPVGGANRPAAPLLRGIVAAVLTAGLALAAHGSAGGACPPPRAAILLLATAAVIGCAAGAAARSAGPPRSRTALFAALLTGQAAGHTVLMLAASHYGASGMHAAAMHMAGHMNGHMIHPGALQGLPGLPGPAMIAAHIGASALCAILVSAAESLYDPILSALDRLLPVLPPAPAEPDVPVALPAGRQAPVHSAPPTSVLSSRGPPRRLLPA